MGILWLVLIFGVFAAKPLVDDREWVRPPPQLDEIKDVAGDRFGNPSRIWALPGGGFVLNDSWVLMRAFNVDGTVRWTVGGRGGGPGEFQNIQDVAMTAEGKVLVLDDETVRITILDAATGKLLETVPVGQKAAGGLSQILSVGPPHLAIVQHGHAEDGNWSILDVNGAVVRTYTLPPPCGATVVCSAYTEGVPENGGGVVAFRWSSDLLFLSTDGSVRKVQDGIEPIRMPDPVRYTVDPEDVGLKGARYLSVTITKADPKATVATKSLAIGGSRVFVLTQGSTENRGRIVDIYTLDEGDYEGSFILPWPVRDVAVIDEGVLATLTTELFPTVTLWDIEEL